MVSLLAVELAISTKWPEFIIGVVSVPDAKKGEQLVLITNCKDITTEKLMDAIRQAGLTELAIPKKVMYMEKPPLFGTGKFDYPTETELAKKEMENFCNRYVKTLRLKIVDDKFVIEIARG